MKQSLVYQEIILDFDQYTGNYERDLATFLFGVFDQNERDNESPFLKDPIKWGFDQGGEELLDMIADPEYGQVWQTIVGVPSNSNIQEQHYQVIFRFVKPLSNNQIKEIYDKAMKFGAWQQKSMPSYFSQALTNLLDLRICNVVKTKEISSWKDGGLV